MNRTIKNAFRFAGVLIAVVFIIVISGFWKGWKTDPDAVVVETKKSPETIHIGDPIRIEITTELPWHRQPKQDIKLISKQDGLEVLKATERHFTGISWGKWKWRSILELQAYDFGPFTELQSTLQVTPNRKNENSELTVKLPDLKITPKLKSDDNDLAVAGELTEDFLKKKGLPLWGWIVIGIIIIAIAIMVYLYSRKKQSQIPDPPKPWVVAEEALLKLKERLPLPAESVFVDLTDIVRHYIEAIYRIPATERTTPEFLIEIKRDGTKMSADHSLLLADFLTAADMVKFARLDASQGQIDEAIKKAQRFVVETSEPLIRALSATDLPPIESVKS